MSRWFKFPDDTINDPTLQRLPGEKFKAWVNLLCIASKHSGALPPVTDLAFLLRLGEDKIAALLDEFVDKGLLDAIEGEPMSYAPHDWKARQYADGTAAERAKRHRDKKRDGNGRVTRDERGATVAVTALEQNRREKNRAAAVTPLIEVTDEDSLAAWDAYGCDTQGKPFPRNRRGGWCFPSKWPPGHQAEVHAIAVSRGGA